MALIDKIESELKEAMRSQNTQKVAVLRLLKSSLHNQKINLGHDLSESEVIAVLEKEAKQRRDSIEAYRQGGRDELAKSEEVELALIASYLPEKMDEAELEKIVVEVINELGANSPSQMGQVIGRVREKTGGSADGAAIAALAKAKLSR